ncbi:MAG TPA: hypothetical protein VHW01_23615, partial [Polyangiaceae bacterium]|nr:hypothetical protein [Polyangiaceae bacterium]
TRQIVPTISLGEVNALARERAAVASRVVTIHAPTNAVLPTSERLQTLRGWKRTGSLPSKSPHEYRQGSRISYPTGVVQRTVSFEQEPKSLVWLSSSAPLTWSREAQRDAQVLEWLLRIRLRELLRDDLGGV